MQSHAGVDDGTLGLALLFVGAGALIAMRFAGELVDRWGERALLAVLLVFAAAAVLPALPTSAVALCAALFVIGAASGALDVAINAEAVGAESTGRPLMNLAHATFSIGVVVTSLVTGALRGAGAGPGLVLGLVAGVLLACTLVAATLVPAPAGRTRRPRPSLTHVPRALALLGALTALAFVIEGVWQNWSAVHLEVTLDAGATVAALGPALFAGAAATGRLSGQAIVNRVPDGVAVGVGALVAGLGTVLAALAPSVVLALTGIVLAGLGTSICAPTLFSRAGRIVPDAERGSAVSIVVTIAYLGFLIGPAVVGVLADAMTLRASLAAMVAVALALAVLAWRLTHHVERG